MAHNRALGQAAGIPVEKLEALEGDYAASGFFSNEELAVIGWAEAVASNTARRNVAAFEAITEHFDTPQIVELTVIIAVRTMVNLIQEALWTDLEGPETPPNSRSKVPFEPDEWYSWYLDEFLGSQKQRSMVSNHLPAQKRNGD